MTARAEAVDGRGPWHWAAAWLAVATAFATPEPARGQDVDAEVLPPRVGEMLRTEGLTPFERSHYVLLVFAPSSNDSTFLDQMARLKEQKAKLPKDVVVAAIFEYQGGQVGTQEIDMSDATALRRRYEVEDGFIQNFLVGKDGAVQWKQRGPLKVPDLMEQLKKLQEGESAR